MPLPMPTIFSAREIEGVSDSKFMRFARASALIRRLLLLAAITLAVSHRAAGAQSAPQMATRAALSAQASQLESQLATQRLKSSKQAEVRAELEGIKRRLAEGDFHVGDRFVYTLVQDSVRSDTASVREGLVASIGSLPDFVVKGVLRSELTETLTAHVTRYIKRASVRTNVLTRVAILGAVRSPGYYYASPDRPISELVMTAGGPSTEANLGQLEIRRGKAVVLSAGESKKAIKDGRTIEQADVQSGDEVRIPEKRKLNWQSIIQLMFVVSSLFFAFIQFIQWYYNRQN